MSIDLEKSGLDRFEKITKIATLKPIYCNEKDSITQVADKILETGHRSLPVVNKKNEILGIVTIIDILSSFLRKEDFAEKISTIMSRDVLYCNDEDTVGYVLQKFKMSRRGRFPIIHDNKVIGLVAERDIVKYFSGVNFGITIENIMTKKPFFMKSGSSLMDCLKSSVNTRYRRLPIVNNPDDKKLLGLITVVTILKYLKDNKFDYSALSNPIENIMIKNVFYTTADKDVSEAIKIMKYENISGLPVTEDGRLVGFVTERDILEEIV
jgi:predicted transcriptional regulator